MLWFWLIALVLAGTAGLWIVRPLVAGQPAANDLPARGLALSVLGLVPLCALGFYLAVGRPELATGALMAAQRNVRAYVQLVDELKAKVAARPDDAEGQRLLATSLSRLERYAEAVPVYSHAIALGVQTPEMFAGLGEALTQSSGQIGAEAMAAFDKALKIDPRFQQALYFRSAGYFAQGDLERAIADWTNLAAVAPPGSPVALAASRNIEMARQIGGAGADGDAIRGMVDRLAERLSAEPADGPHDLEGWEKLVRSYTVLGETDKAAAARDKAKAFFPTDKTAQDRLDAAAR